MKNRSIKSQLLLILTLIISFTGVAQLPNPAIVGYWESWNGSNFVNLKDIDSRYNVIQISFASQIIGDYSLTYAPPGSYTETTFKSEVAALQAQGKKVLISIGGQNDHVVLDSIYEKDEFVSSVNALIDYWGFDGLDIDLEGNSLSYTDINIDAPGDIKQQLMITGIQEILANHQAKHGKKLLLTMAPETYYVMGALSYGGAGSLIGAYLPMIQALRNDIDMLNVQLYNSGSMYGLDGGVYTQGSADFILAMTEAVIQGFTGTGNIGTYDGFPASKVGVGLPGCHSSDAVPHLVIEKAIAYLRGYGPKPGNYTLQQAGGYPDIRGMMTWSINSDRKCYPSYGFVDTWSKIFTDDPYILISTPTDIYEQNEEGGIIQVELLNDTFNNPLDTVNWTLDNLPDGVMLDSLVRVNDTTVNIILVGNSSAPYDFLLKKVTVTVDSNDFGMTTNSLTRNHGILLKKYPTTIPGKVESEYISDEENGVIHSMNNNSWNNQDAYFLRLNQGNWGEFEVDVEVDGNYTADWRFTTGNGASGAIKVSVDGKLEETVNFSSNTAYTTWNLLSYDIYLKAGLHTIKMDSYSGWLASDYMNFRLTTAVEVLAAKSQLFYPNPTDKTIFFKEVFEGTIGVYGLNGQLIQESTKLNTNSYDVANLKNGVYILKFTNIHGSLAYNKLVKK
jgi:chitinase